MKALTVCQPYAELIARGEKVIENRTRRFKYRGDIAIHAGRSKEWLTEDDRKRFPFMSFGHVIAVARLYDCLPFAEVCQKYPALMGVPHLIGPWCLLLCNIRRVKPWPAKGMLGLWEFSGRLDIIQTHDRFGDELPRPRKVRL